MSVKEKHEGGPEIALTFMKTVKIFAIFSEKDSIFPGELRLSRSSGQFDLDRFLSPRKIDGLVKSLLKRHPGEPRIMSGAGAGVQTSSRRKSGTIPKIGSRFSPGTLDSGFSRNDEFYRISTFYAIIKIEEEKEGMVYGRIVFSGLGE